MSELLSKLKERYQIGEHETKAIFNEYLLPSLKFYAPATNPTAVIVGGQPGAGKSSLIEFVKNEFSDNIVECNADQYRQLHPKAKEILYHYENLFPNLTTELAQSLNLMLRNECKKQGLNFVLEITMSNGAGANATIQGIKEIGYICNVDLLAVNEKWSRLGTIERLEAQRATERFGRVVSSEFHDRRYNEMPLAVKEVAEKKLYDNIRLFGRVIVDDKNRREQKIAIIANNPANPVLELIKQRLKIFTIEEKKLFVNEVNRVAKMMEKRQAPQNEVSEFIKSFLPAESRLRRNRPKL